MLKHILTPLINPQLTGIWLKNWLQSNLQREQGWAIWAILYED